MSRCTRWRKVALATPSLWAYIHFGWPAHVVARFLARSRKARLYIGINKDAFTSGNFPRFHDELNSLLNRVERLSIKWCPYHQPHGYLVPDPNPISSVLLNWISDILNGKHKVPHLWQLHLKFYEREPVRTETLSNLPHLLEICSRSISLTTLLPVSYQLRRVDIDYCHTSPIHLINLLASAPMLEDVHFFHENEYDIIHEGSFEDLSSNQSTISLSHLKTFTIGWCRSSFVDELLSRITYPPSAEISLSICREPSARIMTDFPLSLRSALLFSTSLSIDVERYRIGEALSAAPFALHFSSSRSADYHVDFNERGARSERIAESSEMIDDISSMGPFENLQYFSIAMALLPDSHTMTRLFDGCSEIENLAVTVRDIDNLITALSPSESTTPPCPKLRTLSLFNSKFNPFALRDVIQERNKQTVPLKELRLRKNRRLRPNEAGFPSVVSVLSRLEGMVVTIEEDIDEYSSSSSDTDSE
ncbi:hypothetical protein SISSUDRAFT_297417 [Sistotremastrum suecicum HHB10207 ss-3]|uniref:F-box domain-containing protein n=1 Tax=Sistotremastrum suecicum HHB10207 ss-3 TaxID=1314776 RepID=A0A165ZGC8_9AGAM|nr:hypothetical protein SISSUDRAFT_297417 [Sistotremastrum suecicum HHB10207 ss-3]